VSAEVERSAAFSHWRGSHAQLRGEHLPGGSHWWTFGERVLTKISEGHEYSIHESLTAVGPTLATLSTLRIENFAPAHAVNYSCRAMHLTVNAAATSGANETISMQQAIVFAVKLVSEGGAPLPQGYLAERVVAAGTARPSRSSSGPSPFIYCSCWRSVCCSPSWWSCSWSSAWSGTARRTRRTDAPSTWPAATTARRGATARRQQHSSLYYAVPIGLNSTYSSSRHSGLTLSRT